MAYPGDYGYIEDSLPARTATRSTPSSPLPESTFPGVLIHARPVGVFHMEDEAAVTTRCCVCRWTPAPGGHAGHRRRRTPHLDGIKHFFERYKDLEKGKHVAAADWSDTRHGRARGP